MALMGDIDFVHIDNLHSYGSHVGVRLLNGRENYDKGKEAFIGMRIKYSNLKVIRVWSCAWRWASARPVKLEVREDE